MIDHPTTDEESVRVTPNNDPIDDEREVDLVGMLIMLARRKKTIAATALAAAFFSAVVSLILPSIYQANVKLLPPQQAQSTSSMLISQLGGLAGVAAGAAGLKNPAEIYVAMLKSRTVADRMIDRFALQKHYGIESREETRRVLEKNSSILVGKDGLITVLVEDKNQQLVAPMANGYVDELLRFSKTLAVTQASQRRLFFEQELQRSKVNLVNAEIALKKAIDEHGVISVDTEGRAQLATIAKLRAEITAKEIALDSMKAFVTSSHPEYQRLQESLESLRSEVSRLETGRREQSVDGGSVSTASGNGIKNVQLLRDVKYYESLYELLAKQYEAARLDEAKDPSVLQVLDPAITPELRARPKRALIVLISTLLATVASIVVVLLVERRRDRLHASGSRDRWSELKSNLRFN